MQINGGDDRNRTGVDGVADRCVTTPPRRLKTKKRLLLYAVNSHNCQLLFRKLIKMVI